MCFYCLVYLTRAIDHLVLDGLYSCSSMHPMIDKIDDVSLFIFACVSLNKQYFKILTEKLIRVEGSQKFIQLLASFLFSCGWAIATAFRAISRQLLRSRGFYHRACWGFLEKPKFFLWAKINCISIKCSSSPQIQNNHHNNNNLAYQKQMNRRYTDRWGRFDVADLCEVSEFSMGFNWETEFWCELHLDVDGGRSLPIPSSVNPVIWTVA